MERKLQVGRLILLCYESIYLLVFSLFLGDLANDSIGRAISRSSTYTRSLNAATANNKAQLGAAKNAKVVPKTSAATTQLSKGMLLIFFIFYLSSCSFSSSSDRVRHKLFFNFFKLNGV